MVEIGKGMTERALNSPNLAPLYLALNRHGNRDQLGEMFLLFGSALAQRVVLTDVELEDSVPQYLKRSEQLKN